MKAIGHFSRSSSFQVGALFTFLLTLGVLFVAYFLHLATNQVFLKESQVAIEAELDGLSRLYELHGVEAFNAALDAKVDPLKRNFFYAFKQDGSLTPRSDFLYWPQLGREAEREPVQYDPDHFDDSLMSGIDAVLMLKQVTLSDGSQLIVARDVHDLNVAQWVARTFGWLMIGTMILISGLSLWVGYYVVDRINRIADTTDRIVQEGALHERLPIDSSWDDLSQLSSALNRTLDELDQMVQSIKSVTDNIAHDLRTPLTRLRADIEHVSDHEHRSRLLKEVDGIMAMFKGLLRIADVESNKKRQAFAVYSLNTILEDVIELYGPVAEDKAINVQHQINPAMVEGDRDLLFQALANVLDNAIKFTPENGTITLVLSCHNREAIVHVCDSGPGIPQALTEKVTRRFFRADDSRNTAGYGLGLAMVNAVVKLHKGSLLFKENPHSEGSPGLCCSISLPLSA
ncbi:sensor histidine kinase [Alteromonas sediminis]|uniref:histidine kinase n=1 Tax=Alteromonas sediminis TaxID=2259342 RepID=A0A3N5Z6S8_9ALTE|nr:HAMP domain-containing sensor histidine kinase [Alteromonas sediminis]RPJ66304.1 sensor histidine kinase [Alteromonas sediminis]